MLHLAPVIGRPRPVSPGIEFSQTDVGELRSLIDEMASAAAGGDLLQLVRCDIKFHEEICRLGGNGRLVELMKGQGAIIRALLQRDLQNFYGRPEDIVGEHRVLLRAIESRNAHHVEVLLTEHLEDARARLTEYLVSAARDRAAEVTTGQSQTLTTRRD